MYNVAFVYTKKAGGYHGVITWTSYPTKKEFDKEYAKLSEEAKEKQRVLEEGISVERCLELVEQTPLACLIAAEFQKQANLSE